MAVIFLVFQWEISGKDFNELHSLNMLLISVVFVVSHLEISGIDINEIH